MKLGPISVSLVSPFLTANPELSRLIARLKLLTCVAPPPVGGASPESITHF